MYTDLRAQIDGAARWARARMEADAGLSLGVFIPNLAEFRSQIERTFDRVFYPGSGLRYVAGNAMRAEDVSIFHINRAQSLYEHPIVANALLLLELARPRIESSAATAILRSPFIHGVSRERGMRALADLRVRRLREMDLSLRDIESATRSCPLLTETWRRVREVLRSKPHQGDASAWSKFFGDLVQATGWPGDAELTAAEQQLVEAWKDSLSALAALGLVSPMLAFDAALARLRQILGAGGIQRGDWFSPIQILDAADARGLEFDYSYVIGLSEETWPPALRISPIIPVELQRAFGVPNSTPASLHGERTRLTEELFSSSREVVGGFSERLSPLAARHCVILSEQAFPEWSGKTPLESFIPATLDEIDDSQAPPFDLTRDAMGGTGIIKSQSQCGFRAFAEFRLGAQSPEDSCFGFDARDRGGFLHKALQFVWAELEDSDTLKKYPEAALQELIRTCVEKAVSASPDSAFHGQTALVERERLESLLWEWLNQVEKLRKQSFTVEQIENELLYDLAGLPLRLRVDRIDRLSNGGLLLIDYKSGKVTKNKLDCPRPSEPQLLVYASAKSPKVEGMLFGAVRARESRIVGKTRDRQFAGGSTSVLGDKWDDFVLEAEQTVRRLAAEFIAGNALVDPLKDACNFCGSAALCRIRETRSEAEEEA
jgi:probable DNA repair protein